MWRAWLDRLNGTFTSTLVTVLLGLLSFLGAALWWGQKDIAEAITDTNLALRELATEFKSYKDWNSSQHDSESKQRERLEREQNEIVNRLNRAGVKP